LAVSKRLVELHGGRVWFDTLSNTFHIAFPAAAQLFKRPTIATDLKALESDPRPLILVIDDDVEAIEVMQGYLEPAGYRIFGALSGHEGILRARELTPALITLDSRMPGLDGWGVLDILRGDDTLSKIPVIMISITDHHHLVGQLENVVNALTKPISKNGLLNAVNDALQTVRV
jgi:CheY-like chemotaxis protein